MKSLFEMAGISNEALEDDNIRKQIYDVIEKQGGLDAVKQQINQRAPPPAPTSGRGKLLVYLGVLQMLALLMIYYAIINSNLDPRSVKYIQHHKWSGFQLLTFGSRNQRSM